jgi:maleate cis-trans isomerase
VKAVYGTKGRIGLVVPANNSVIEPELWQAMPQGCAAYATRVMARGELTPEAVRRMERDVDGAMAAIAATGVDVIAYCDMVTSFIMEAGWNEAAMQRFSASTGVACISAWTALRDALAKLGARRLALGTPYPAAIHALVPDFFRRNHFEVKAQATLDILAMREVPTIGPERLAAFIDNFDLSHCDVLVLLATDLPTFGSIAALEAQHGVPVLTSNQTILWRALRELGSARPRGNLGRLFDEPN